MLDDISFALPKGETIAIVGASGCGKSTLLRLISGILDISNNELSGGKISIDNTSADNYRKAGNLAFMFQEATLMPNLTVRQNIEFPLRIKGRINKEKIDQLLNTVGLFEFENYLPKQLSGGMKTRVALARAFVTEPELLLLDEPFSALDIAWKSDLYKWLENLKEKFNTTVIIVTHDVQEAILLSNKVIVLNRFGQIQPPVHPVISEKSLPQRVKNISGFLEEENYQRLFISIQDIILKDGKRNSISKSEVLQLIDDIILVAGNEYKESQLTKNELDAVRDFSNDAEVNAKLLIAFQNSKTDYLRYQLIWDILEFDALPETIHEKIFTYYLEHIDAFSEYSRRWYALHDDERFFDILKGRVESRKGFNQKKKWIYLCDLYAVKELPHLGSFLDNVIAGKIEHVDHEFAKKVAKKIKMKIEDEQKTDISVA